LNEIYSEGKKKNNGEINRIQNNIVEQTDHRRIYEVHFKSTITYKTETRTLTKRNKSKIQVMDMKFLESKLVFKTY
jgi:hypothetical protein